ncbi:MAG TPA: outer membrane beta-barrel protein [Xanthobacteraceae bacterium]|jgi:opacity protein-like surface antigen
MRLRVNIRLVCTTAIVGICAAQMAHAADAEIPAPPAVQSPWYLQGSAGAFWRMNASRTTNFINLLNGATSPGFNNNTYDPGPAVFFGVGYRLPHGFRIEGEFGYAHFMNATASPLSLNGAFPGLNGGTLSLQSGGGHSQYSAMVNGFYDVPFSMWGRVTPYVGAGLGAVVIDGQTAVFANANNTVRFSEGSTTGTRAALMAEVGLNVTIDPKWTFVPAYRFQHIFLPSGSLPYESNIFELGFRYSM